MPKKVLIVEDNDLNLRLFNDLLAAEGYDTVTSTGEGDIAGLAARTRPDLILMDIRHGGGDGLETTRRIKSGASTGSIPVIAVTACAAAGDEDLARATGCVDYLMKPVSLAGLLRSVRDNLHG
ncbi:MAG: response regulator [Paracoccaceae bacterium]